MINWLLSLINKRQRQLYEENQRLLERNRNYRMAFEELSVWVQSQSNHTLLMRQLTDGQTDPRIIEANRIGEIARSKIKTRLKALEEKIHVR